MLNDNLFLYNLEFKLKETLMIWTTSLSFPLHLLRLSILLTPLFLES